MQMQTEGGLLFRGPPCIMSQPGMNEVKILNRIVLKKLYINKMLIVCNNGNRNYLCKPQNDLYIHVTVHRDKFLLNLLKPNDIYTWCPTS